MVLHVYIHTYIYIYVYTHIYIYTYTYIYIYCYSTDYSQQAGWLHLPGQLSILLPQPAD